MNSVELYLRSLIQQAAPLPPADWIVTLHHCGFCEIPADGRRPRWLASRGLLWTIWSQFLQPFNGSTFAAICSQFVDESGHTLKPANIQKHSGRAPSLDSATARRLSECLWPVEIDATETPPKNHPALLNYKVHL